MDNGHGFKGLVIRGRAHPIVIKSRLAVNTLLVTGLNPSEVAAAIVRISTADNVKQLSAILRILSALDNV